MKITVVGGIGEYGEPLTEGLRDNDHYVETQDIEHFEKSIPMSAKEMVLIFSASKMIAESLITLIRQRKSRSLLLVVLIGEYSLQSLPILRSDLLRKEADDAQCNIEPREVLARVRSLERRTRRCPEILKVGGLELSPGNGLVLVEGDHVTLTKKEFLLVETLASRPGAVFTHENLMMALYEPHEDIPEEKIIMVFVCKIRKKFRQFNSFRIETSWGQGFRLVATGL